MSGEVNMIPTLRKFRGGASPSKFGGGQSRYIFRGGPVKKITLYMMASLLERNEKKIVLLYPNYKEVGGSCHTTYDKVSANGANSEPKPSKFQSGHRVVIKVLSTQYY